MLHVHAFLGWRDVSSTHESLIFALLQEGDTGPSISISVVIKSNFSYMIHVRGRQLEIVSPDLLNLISSIKCRRKSTFRRKNTKMSYLYHVVALTLLYLLMLVALQSVLLFLSYKGKRVDH